MMSMAFKQQQPQQQQQPQPQSQQQPHQLPYISVERKDLHQLEVRLLSIPGMKVSYEINSYKQLSGDSFYIIPKGKKCVVWFTTSYKMGAPTAIFYELDPRDHTKIKFISLREPHPACAKLNPELFTNDGTICYGTLFSAQGHQFFSVENIFVYRGRALDAMCVRDKRALITEMFDDGLGASSSCDNGDKARAWFGMPIRCASYADALKTVSTTTTYSVYAIQARFDKQTDNKYFQNCQNQNQATVPQPQSQPQPQPQLNRLPTHINRYPQPQHQQQQYQQQPHQQQQYQQQPHQQQQQQRTRVFIIRAEPQADIYTLRCPDTDAMEPEHAHIGDYKTSVFMNSVFRKIRENASLDAAEESDDEAEFQKTHHEHSHTNLEKSARILCAFNYRFKRWMPLKLAA